MLEAIPAGKPETPFVCHPCKNVREKTSPGNRIYNIKNVKK